jgi:hypothetical protein
MKNQVNRLLIAYSIIFLFSCKKSDADHQNEAASITVINAITDAGAIKINNTGRTIFWSANSEQIVYGARGFYFAAVGSKQFVAVPTTDTTKILLNKSFNFERRVYTLYLAGTKVEPDTLFKVELNYPFIRTDVTAPPSADSVVNMRFVNLALGSPALKITTATSNEVDNLPYKGIGAWKRYDAKLAATTYSFQIRRLDNDVLITTYNFSVTASNRFRNVTLLIRGIFGTTAGTAPFGVVPINYF